MADPRLHRKLGTFRQLEIFLKVAELGSISAAAEALHLAQPSVTMQVKKLAEAVGLPLYEQIGRKIFLTDAGKSLQAGSVEVFDALARLDMRLSDLRGLTAGTLRIAVVTTAKYFIPELLGPFCARYPGVAVEFTVGNRGEMLDRLIANRDDLYLFSHPPEEPSVVAEPFIPNPLVVVAPPGHPLAGKKRLPLSRLLQEEFLMREPGSGTRHAVEQFLAQSGVGLNVRMTIASNEAIKHSVRAGLGLAILSAHTLSQGEDLGLPVLDVQGFPIQHHWYLVRLKGKQSSVVAQAFYDYLQAEGREQLAALPALRHSG